MFGALVAAMMMFQDDTGIAVARPIGDAVLEPVSGSYFQIFEFFGRPPHTWRHASRMVKGYRHADRDGHLAYVKEGATHFFLVLNFDLLRTNRVWIGLSARCNESAELYWADDTPLTEGSFRAWSPVAQKRFRDQCRSLQNTGTDLPVYYDPTEFGVRWEVANPNANIQHMMVEFPVPSETDGEDEEQGQ